MPENRYEIYVKANQSIDEPTLVPFYLVQKWQSILVQCHRPCAISCHISCTRMFYNIGCREVIVPFECQFCYIGLLGREVSGTVFIVKFDDADDSKNVKNFFWLQSLVGSYGQHKRLVPLPCFLIAATYTTLHGLVSALDERVPTRILNKLLQFLNFGKI